MTFSITSSIPSMMSAFICELHSLNDSAPANCLQIQDLESIVRALENNKEHKTALGASGITEDLLARFNNADEYDNFIAPQNLKEVQSLLEKISDLIADFHKQNSGSTTSTDSQTIEKITNGQHKMNAFILKQSIEKYNEAGLKHKIFIG